MNCENCNSEMAVKYGSGRFCSNKCARGFSTKSKRSEINEKVSNSLKGKITSDETRKLLKEAWVRGCYDKVVYPKADIADILIENSTFSGNYIKNRLFEAGLKEYECEECYISFYNGKPITLQIHHINGNNKDQRIENLSILCPNCHSQTNNYAGKNRSLLGVTG